MAYLDNLWQDVHGAGSQKSDVMVGNPANFPSGRGPQGDAVRIYNYVRLVRTTPTTSGLNEFNSNGQINIYPNPVLDICNITMNKKYNQIKIDIYNALGEKIRELNCANSKSFSININDAPKGIYFMNISFDSNSSTIKLIKK